ncbi:MAG TPA: sucrase ferredoxin [Pyrinomonadaceae bacterium]
MNLDFFYCSALSDRAGEKAFGTAASGDAWLLLEYTRPWGYRAFQESTLERAVKSHLVRALKLVPRSRILLIKQERVREDNRPILFVTRPSESGASIVRLKLSGYEQLPEVNLAGALAGESSSGWESWGQPLFLVCTHGRRDKCCAKFGFSLYKSLRGSANDSTVWQSSHVGGDRFAANLVCFPHGLFYARVNEERGREIMDAYRRGQLSLENYRGRACYPASIQAAEYFVRAEAGLRGLDDLRFLDYEQIRERNWRVRFVSNVDRRTHEVYLKSQLSEFRNLLTCHSTEEKRVVQYSLSEYRASKQV